MTGDAPDLADLLALRELPRDELMQRLGASPSDVEQAVAYEALRPVDRLQVPGARSAYVFLRGDEVVMLYAGRGALGNTSRAELEQALGGPGQELRSRAGKRSLLHVYPDRGVAFSSQGDDLEFLEVFPPTTLERYKSGIYREPGPFVE